MYPNPVYQRQKCPTKRRKYPTTWSDNFTGRHFSTRKAKILVLLRNGRNKYHVEDPGIKGPGGRTPCIALSPHNTRKSQAWRNTGDDGLDGADLGNRNGGK